jgi:hypothetical protein
MNRVNRGIALVFSACLSISICPAQDLRPRAYVITPVHSNAVILSYSFSDGSIFFGSVFPITNNSGRYSVPSLSYYYSFSFFKRSAIGGTISIPFTKHQSVKFSYSNGAYTRFGGTFQTVTCAWQYSWFGRPE